MNKIAISLSLLLAITMGAVALMQSRNTKRLERTVTASRLETEEMRRLADARNTELGSLKERLSRIKEDVAELPELRGEVTQLRTKNAELEEKLMAAQRTAELVQSRLQATQSAVENSAAQSGFTEISLDQAPAHIRNRIALQYPGATIGELVQVTEDGRTLYSLEGVTANEREMRAVLDANGEILEQAIEMSFREVPNVVKGAVARQLNRDGGIDMTQVWENGRTTYTGNAEQNGQEMHFEFSESGELLRYEAWVEEPTEQDVLRAVEAFEAGTPQ